MRIRDAQVRQMANASPQTQMVQPCPETATWLEIRLVTDDGTPVAGEAIKVQLPDRSIHEVKLNAEGMVRFDNIVAGEASVSFPEIIDHDWRLADGNSPQASSSL